MFESLTNLAIGGIIGTVARYFLSGFVYRVIGSIFPYGTLAVNLLGCLIAGFLVSLSENKFMFDANAQLLLTVGFCGSFTTFSTFVLETNNLLKEGEIIQAFVNIIVSVTFGIVIFRIGALLGETIK